MKVSFDLSDSVYKKLKEEGEKESRNVSQMLRWILFQRYEES